MTKKILVVSDFHCGSMVGIMPEKVRMYDPAGQKRIAAPSKDQGKLLKAYMEMVSKVGPVDSVVLNGDLPDGTGKKEQGLGQWSTCIMDQVGAAVDLAKRIRFKGKPDYVVSWGSPYHVERNPCGDALVAEALGVSNNHHGIEVLIQSEGKNIHVSHKVGVSIAAYKSTAIMREISNDLLTALDKHFTCALILRAHCHYSVSVEYGGHWGITSPCWQFRTPYMSTLGIGLQPHIGYVVLEIAKDGIHFDKKLYDVPSPIQKVTV